MENARKTRTKKDEIEYGYYSQFPQKLRDLLVGHTQDELAKYIGVQRQTVAQWKDGKTKPDIYYLSLIADFFGVTTDYILGRESARSHDETFICDATGLSPSAVSMLSLYNKKRRAYKKRSGLILSIDDGAIYSHVIDFLNNLITHDESAKKIGNQYINWLEAIEFHDEFDLEFKEKLAKAGVEWEHGGLLLSSIVNGERYELVRLFEDFLSSEHIEVAKNMEQSKNGDD